jgi:hypothetical protein
MDGGPQPPQDRLGERRRFGDVHIDAGVGLSQGSNP